MPPHKWCFAHVGVLGILNSESSKSNLVTGVVFPRTSLEWERCMKERVLPEWLEAGESEGSSLGLVTRESWRRSTKVSADTTPGQASRSK